MRFSTKSRYALRLMEELAYRGPDACVSIKEISESQSISLKYLEQIVTPLARAGLVASERGSHGGYRLTRSPAEYTTGDILRAIEGPTVPVPCMEPAVNPCPRSESCHTLRFWQGLDAVMTQYLDSVTLADLLAGDCGICRSNPTDPEP